MKRIIRPRMTRLPNSDRIAMPPGTVKAPVDALPPTVRVTAYSAEHSVEEVVTSVDAIDAVRGDLPVLWVDVVGLGDASLIRALGRKFSIHRLALEDVLNVPQRPKVEPLAVTVFVVSRIASLGSRLDTQQVSFFFGEGFVLTFRESEGGLFDPISERIRSGRGRIRGAGADYLAYTVLDTIIDSYFPVLEEFDERMQRLEDRIMGDPRHVSSAQIHGLKRDLLGLRRSLWPMREGLHSLLADAMPFVQPETRPYLRDCYDHVVQLIDLSETYRELGSGLMDLYLSSLSNRMNEIMKVLTMVATIFIPLSFVVGLYGMNFDTSSPYNLPELGFRYGYPVVLAVMATIVLGMLWFFKKHGWLGSIEPPEEDED